MGPLCLKLPHYYDIYLSYIVIYLCKLFYANIVDYYKIKINYRFWEKFDFPYAVGCIDCTHVAIVPPPNRHPVYPEHIYVNRKGYHSINVQLVRSSYKFVSLFLNVLFLFYMNYFFRYVTQISES